MDLLQMYGPTSPLQYESGHKFRLILTVMDCFSKYCWLIPLKTKQAIEVANGLCSIFKQFGCPHILHSDNGGEFVSHVTEILCSKLNIKVVHGRPYHPQSQGQVENLNKRVKRAVVSMLLKFKKEDQAKVWPSLLNDVTQLWNNTFNNAIKDVPFRVFFGRNSGQFGLNNTFGLWPSDEELLHLSKLRTTQQQQPECTDEAVVDVLEEEDFEMDIECQMSKFPEFQSYGNLCEIHDANTFLDLCFARDEMQRKTMENLEHNALKNQIAYIKKSGKGKHFVCRQEVLFSNPHQQGLVKIHNMKGKIVDALSGNYYHVTFTAQNEKDSGQTQHSIALHASSLAPFLPTDKPEHEQIEKCREISVVERISPFADIQRLTFYKSKQTRPAPTDGNVGKLLNDAFAILHHTNTTTSDTFSMHVQHLHFLCSLQATILVQNALTVGQHVITSVAITGI